MTPRIRAGWRKLKERRLHFVAECSQTDSKIIYSTCEKRVVL